MTEYEAFIAMKFFLEEFYERTDSDDVATLLSGMLFLESGETMDPAAWEDWLIAVKKAKSGQ